MPLNLHLAPPRALRPVIALLAALLLVCGCATSLQHDEARGAPKLSIQQAALSPANGGQIVQADDLRPGDILLSSGRSGVAVGIQVLTMAPVSHASLYLGDQRVVEAVGEGIRERPLQAMIEEEHAVVAFRHPGIARQHVALMDDFFREHAGRKYNYVGVLLQAPFTLERKVCELPLVPPLVRDFCIRGIASIQLGLGRNDQFFCSQFVLEAYRRAGVPLTDADPRLVSPADLLHMREGDVSSVRIHQPLVYVGHLKFGAGTPVAANP